MVKQPNGDSSDLEVPSSARGPRSPNFPSLSLPDAIAKVQILYEKDRRAAVSVGTVLKHFGFGEKLSGSSARVISALRQFGLLEEASGSYRVSEAAFHILSLSETSPERLAKIQECARKPAIYSDLLREYPDGLPSDHALKDHLVLRKKFNPASTDTFLRVFKASMAFAKLTPGAYTPPENEDNRPAVRVGDFVQWESQGVLQFSAPVRVTGLSDDGTFVFVEGSVTGLPSEQILKVDPPSTPPPGGPTLAKPTGSVREVSVLVDGEAMLQWPATLSAEGVSELEDWLALVVKKMKRRYGGSQQ